MMDYDELGRKVDDLRSNLAPAVLEQTSQGLMRQGEDVGGGINALRLVKHLLGEPEMRDGQAVWAYDRLKPTFRTAFAEIESLFYFEGD